MDNGLAVYSYRFKSSSVPSIGLMADEVEKLHPHAVTTHGPSSYKMVDYAEAVK